MSWTDDYVNEMPTARPIDDATAETLLTGGTVDADLEPLAAALQAYRRAAERPVPPSPELAAQMTAGLFIGPTELTERYDPVLDTGDGHHNGQRHRTPGKRWRRGSGRVLAKVARMSLAAKACAVLGIATATATAASTAGLAGVLPDPAQDGFESVVESVTRYEFPDRVDRNPEFGEQTSEDAKRDGVDGNEVGEDARRQGERRRPDQLPAPVPSEPGQPAEPGKPELPTPDESTRPGNPPIDPPGERRRPPAPPGQ